MKKLSGANLTSQHNQLTFFIDISLGQKIIANSLREKGEKVEVHDKHFKEGTVDEVWLEKVGKKGWVILTKDRRIRYRNNEINALVRAKARAFVLTAGNLDGKGIAESFIQSLPRIKRIIRNQKAPFIARVTRSGDVSLIYPK